MSQRKPHAYNKPIDISEVERLATIGLSIEEIALTLGISGQTLFRKKRQFKEIEEAIHKGRNKGIVVVSNSLFKKAAGGDVKAGIWWMGQYAGRTQRTINEHLGKDGGPIEISDARESLERKLLAFVATGAIAQVHQEPDE